MIKKEKHEHWSSQWLFVMAAVGSAVGLANIWRFPYTTGENGGGAFVFVYLFAVAFLALPLLIAELMIGRRGQDCPSHAVRKLAQESGASRLWALVGFSGLITTSLLLSFYSVIGGETILYGIKNLLGQFVGIAPEASSAISSAYNGSWLTVLGGHSLFMLITVFISAMGVSGGVEKAVKVMMPLLFLILLIMVVYAVVAGDFAAALAYLFTPDFSRLNGAVILDAFGQAFFSVSVGATTMMAYGAYLHKRDSISTSGVWIVSADTLVAMLAGLAIFPIIFAYGVDAGAGPALVFEAIPLAFGNMPGGQLIGTLFFILLAFAALTSSISMLEVPVAWLDSKDNWSRKRAAVVCGLVIWALGILPVLSLNKLSAFFPLGAVGVEKTFFDLFDYFVSNLLLPLTGLFTAIFVGWFVPKSISRDELQTLARHHGFKAWIFLLRYLVPLVMGGVFLSLVV